MALPLKLVASMIGINARDFIEGWYEGYSRCKANTFPSIVPGSMYQVGTVSFAASQAAVAFYIGMKK